MKIKPGWPVLWRDEHTTQVGIHRPLEFSGLDKSAQDFLARLEYPGYGVGPRQEREYRELLAELAAAELLEPDPVAPPLRNVLVLGAGPLSTAIEQACRQSELGIIRRRRADESWWADYAVVIGLGAVHPASTYPLMREDTPHLLVTTDETGITIGPFVIPGSTACANCLAHHGTDADPRWPVLAAQFCQRSAHAEPALMPIAAALTALALFRLGSSAIADPSDGPGSAVPTQASPAAEVLAAENSLPLGALPIRIEPDTMLALPVPKPHPRCGCLEVQDT